MEIEGFVNILKPPGPTSHDIVNTMRRYLGDRRIGHGGTLDPAASGVLPLAVGRATRLLEYIQERTKSYRAEIVFGRETNTHDAWGEIIAERPLPGLERDRLEQVLSRFRGTLEQVPPMASAVRVEGQRLYNLARKGREVERPARSVYIKRLTLVALWPEGPFPRALLDITCSKGTYIRTLAADLGRALGSGAFLDFLVRTRAGPFHISESFTLEEVARLISQNDYSFLKSPVEVLKDFPLVKVKPGAVQRVLNGAPIKPEGVDGMSKPVAGALAAILSASGQLLAIGRWFEVDGELFLKAIKVLGKRN